jgi:pimeloyl-ACP methyl ester carboxylesterase
MDTRALTVHHEDLTLDVAATVREGSRDLILFLHGLGCDRTSFRFAFESPALADATLLAPDLLGFGDTTRPAGTPCTMEVQARICEALLETFPDHDLHIAAHSMGGAVGLLLSPDVLASAASFVSIEGNLIGADCGILSRQAIAMPRERFVAGGFDALKRRCAKLEGTHVALEKTDALTFHESSESLVAWSDGGTLLERFRSLTCRTAYVHGEENRGFDVIRMLEDIEVVEIPGTGHFGMIDDPDAFYPRLAGICLRPE